MRRQKRQPRKISTFIEVRAEECRDNADIMVRKFVRLFTLNNKYIYQKKKLYIVNRFMVKSSSCCNHKRTAKKCRRKKDRKTRDLKQRKR